MDQELKLEHIELGQEYANYTIHGQLIKKGILYTNKVNVSTLNSGQYMLVIGAGRMPFNKF